MPQAAPVKRLFIANRGEICRRIAVSARSLGIETVCLSEQSTPPIFLAGLISHYIAVPEENPQLYLHSEGLIRFAQEAGCDSLHPGFGFLSENSAFAAAVAAAGLSWIGPSAAAIAAMASKDGARALAAAQGVPCPAAYREKISSPTLTQELLAAADSIGYPLLVKAAGGGGGKGMRLVTSPAGMAAALEQAHREALHFFADGSLLLEQYLSGARHIEVQLLADHHGTVIVLGDRDCSLQRRKQKIIEEAPAPHLSPSLRKQLHQYALSLARAVGYRSAGTIEFLVKGEGIYFLEMNTRLQVEHPVSEEVFGLDLVAWQLKIARGEKLPPDLAQRSPRGHSIEARFYGEDPQRDFLPAPGFVPSFVPVAFPGIRWELGLDTIATVASNFDPMIAKLVARADTREEALSRLAMSLEQTFYAGPASNKALLLYFSRGPGASLAWTTDLLDKALPQLAREIAQQQKQEEPLVEEISSWLFAQSAISGALPRTTGEDDEITAVTRQAFGFTAAAPQEASPCQLSQVIRTTKQGCGQLITQLYGVYGAEGINSEPWQAVHWRSHAGQHLCLLWRGYEYHRASLLARKTWEDDRHSSPGEGQLVAPVPGTIVKVSTTVASQVTQDESLFILESMKMEFDVRASRSGTITAINVAAGDRVQAGQVLAIMSS